jgi:hypothetical protein
MTLVGIFLIVLAGFYFLGFYFFYSIISEKIKMLFGYKLYEYTKILSYGMKTVQEWHKNDENALKNNTDFEFVEIIKPHKKEKRIKPLK